MMVLGIRLGRVKYFGWSVVMYEPYLRKILIYCYFFPLCRFRIVEGYTTAIQLLVGFALVKRTLRPAHTDQTHSLLQRLIYNLSFLMTDKAILKRNLSADRTVSDISFAYAKRLVDICFNQSL